MLEPEELEHLRLLARIGLRQLGFVLYPMIYRQESLTRVSEYLVFECDWC